MSLNALSPLDSVAADKALAATMLSLGGPGLEYIPEQYAAISAALVEEVRQALDLRPDDNSAKAVLDIRGYLSREVDRRLFAGVDRKALRESLGTRGALSLGGYDIVESDQFKRAQVKESAKFAIRCVRTADMTQHILSKFATSDDRQFSLFLKAVDGTRGGRHWVIIETLRQGTVLRLSALWRLFPQVVDIDLVSEPMDVLAAFVSVYGLPLTVGTEVLPDNLLLDRFFPDTLGSGFQVSSPANRDTALNAIFMRTPTGTHVALAYCIDIQRYRGDHTRYV